MAASELRDRSTRGSAEAVTRGVHHLALTTEDMKATCAFHVDVVGMPLVHDMKVPPGAGEASLEAMTANLSGRGDG